MTSPPPSLLIYCPYTYGGLFEYTLRQAAALSQLARVELLMPGNTNLQRTRALQLTVHPELPSDEPFQGTLSPFRAIKSVQRVLANYRIVENHVRSGHHRWILFSSYAEYLAPLWSGPFQNLHREGVRFGAVVHDPVRDFQLGPAWWHKKSISAAYSFLDLAFVHEPVALEMIDASPIPSTVVIPHGPYPLPPPNEAASFTRSALQIPETCSSFLSFGHIRDGKNLDLFIRAMPSFPDIHLVVAGKEQSAAQKPAAHYQALAESLGVGPRCRFLPRYIEDQEAANLIAAADVILLTYSGLFHSASGVLNLVAPYRKKILASAGKGPLQTAVRDYQLGTWVKPDDLAALHAGIDSVMHSTPTPRWDDYLRDNTWERNAQNILHAFSSLA